MEIQYIRHQDAPSGYPPLAARAGDFVFVGGCVAAHPTEGVPAIARPQRGVPFHGSSIERQVRHIYDNLSATLEAAGSSIRRVMKINSYHTNALEVDAALRVRKDYFGVEDPPPSTAVEVLETLVRGATVAIDVTALAARPELQREAFHSSQIGPLPIHDQVYGHPIFVQVVRGGGFVFTQGKGPSLPEGPVEEVYGHPDFPYQRSQIRFQTQFVLETLGKMLEAAGSSFEHVVKAEVHLTNMADFAGMDEVWGRFFPSDPPARLVVPVSRLLLEGMLIEIELIAVDPSGPYRKETILAERTASPLGQEPQAVRAGPYLFFSTQLATDYRLGVVPEARPDPNFPFHSSGAKRQAAYILKNVDAICRAAGTSVENLLRRRAFHLDLGEWAETEQVWTETLSDRLPPTTTVRVPGPLLVPGCGVQYDLVALIPE